MRTISIEDWVGRILEGMRYKEKYGRSDRWQVYTNYGRGEFAGYDETDDFFPYNITYSVEKGMVPDIYFRNPYVTVTPSFGAGRDLSMYAKVVEATDNWLIGELALKNEIKTAIRDAYYCGRGIIKVGYDSLGSGKSVKGSGVNAKLAEELGVPLSHLNKAGDGRVEYNVNVKPGMPWAVRVAPEEFIVPFGARTLSNCPWVDHVSVKWLDDVKASILYSGTKKLEGTHLLTLLEGRSGFYQELANSEREASLVEIHEIRDFKTRSIMALVPDHPEWLRPPEDDPLQIEGLPFCDFVFNEDRQFYWAPSDVRILEPQQLEINESNTQTMIHRRLALVKFLVETGAIDDEEIEQMVSATVGPVVKVKGIPSQVVSLLQPHIPQDLMLWVDNVRGRVRELMGQSKQSLGEAPQGRRTKYEMQGVFAGRESRMDERRDAVADCLVGIMRKLNQIIFTRWDAERVIPIVGVDGARYWINCGMQEARGEYTLSVDVESMSSRSKSMKKRELVELIQLLSKNPRVNVSYLMKMLTREYSWVDAMQIFPEAAETDGRPMSTGQFEQHQNQMMGNPEMLQGRIKKNVNRIGEFGG